jgi:hypothetical protein
METFDFSDALDLLKQGRAVFRTGWNAGGQYIYLVEAASYPPKTDIAKVEFGGEDVPYGAYLAIKSAQRTVVPWLASQTDLLANDWQVIPKKESKA